jgi:hypothetical protein
MQTMDWQGPGRTTRRHFLTAPLAIATLAWAIDNVHPAGTLPTSKHIVSFSSVLQAMF